MPRYRVKSEPRLTPGGVFGVFLVVVSIAVSALFWMAPTIGMFWPVAAGAAGAFGFMLIVIGRGAEHQVTATED